MHFSTILTTLTLVATTIAAPAGFTNGLVQFHNNCTEAAQLVIFAEGSSRQKIRIAAGDVWSQKMQSWPGAGKGVSLKFSSLAANAPPGVAQLEYTINSAMGLLFWDLSLIDGNPWIEHNQGVYTDTSSAVCAAGVKECHDAYMTPSDNWATHGTKVGTNLDYYICGAAEEESDSDSDSDSGTE